MGDVLTGRKRATVTLTAGEVVWELNVYLAETISERAFGLSGLEAAEVDAPGMLFVRPVTSDGTFHMGDVKFPLLLAFFSGTGQLVDQVQLAPGAGPWRPQRAFKYVLELLQDFDDAGLLDEGTVLSYE